jgi:SNF2 family DNA or RNA helicase
MDLNLVTHIGDEEISTEIVVAKLTKLRQIVGGAIKNEGRVIPVSRKKVSALREYLEDRDWSKKVVVFCSFIHEIHMVQELCIDLGINSLILDGSTSDRETIQKRFQEDVGIGIIIVQIQVGGEGINLTAADTAIFYSPTYSFIYYDQAKARVHRIGQDSPVTYINLVIEGTIDEEIVGYLEQHGSLSRQLLDDFREY